MRIIFVVPMMTGIGGIQSSLFNLINNIKFEHEIYLCVLGNYIAENIVIPENVRIIKGSKILEYIYLNYHERKNQYTFFEKYIILLIKGLRRILGFQRCLNFVKSYFRSDDKYDIAISYSNDIYCDGEMITGGSNDIVQSCICANKKIAWIHNDSNRLGLNYEICRNTYKDYTYIVNVSYACKMIFDEIMPEYSYKSKVVYNMFDIGKQCEISNLNNPYKIDGFHILTVARLDNQQKRIDRIVECCKKLKAEGIKNFYWHIVGDGPDMNTLLKLAEEYGVNDVLIFEGRKNKPYSYIKFADVFVMTSDYEAYSMVLKESLLVGTPIVCTNYPSASEIVIDGVNGILTKFDVENISNIIKKLISNRELLYKFRSNIKQTNISNEQAMAQLNEILR